MDIAEDRPAIGSCLVRSAVCTIMAVIAAFFGTGAPAATFEHINLSEGHEAILLSGTIEYGDIETFRALSLKYQDAVIVLDSDGGSVAAAIEIGKMIRIAGYPTLVPGDATCVSACALIWLAGAPRLMSPEASIGFHASYRNVDGRKEETGVGNAIVGHYLTLLNLPQRAVIFATTAPPDKLRWLTAENKAESGIDFEYLELGDGKDDAQAGTKAATKAKGGNVAMPPPVILTSQPAPKAGPGKPVAPGSGTKPSVAEFSAYIKGQMANPSVIRKRIADMNMEEGDYPILEKHFVSLSENKKFLDHLAMKILNSLYLNNDTNNSFELARSLAESESSKLFFVGMSRMELEDVREFVRYNYVLSKSLSSKDCNAYFSGKIGDAGLIYRALSSVRGGNLEGFLLLNRRAIEAGLSEYVAEVSLNPEQADAAREAYEALVSDQVMRFPKSEQGKVIFAIDNRNGEEISDKDACSAQQVLFGALYRMDGVLGDWKLRDFATRLPR